eukprot:scaffold24558_cov37-Prasinocladus_malaysianus.AAC.1
MNDFKQHNFELRFHPTCPSSCLRAESLRPACGRHLTRMRGSPSRTARSWTCTGPDTGGGCSRS